MKGIPLKLYQFRAHRKCLTSRELGLFLCSAIIETSRDLQSVTWLLKIFGDRWSSFPEVFSSSLTGSNPEFSLNFRKFCNICKCCRYECFIFLGGYCTLFTEFVLGHSAHWAYSNLNFLVLIGLKFMISDLHNSDRYCCVSFSSQVQFCIWITASNEKKNKLRILLKIFNDDRITRVSGFEVSISILLVNISIVNRFNLLRTGNLS